MLRYYLAAIFLGIIGLQASVAFRTSPAISIFSVALVGLLLAIYVLPGRDAE